jgi:bla regulator protein blaR1
VTANSLSEMWTTLAPAVGNHLWQSTLCAGVVGLLTMVLRKNHARIRYWLWLAASLKFLIPFSLLVIVGSHLPRTRLPAEADARLYAAMNEISQPFTQSKTPMNPAILSSTASARMVHVLSATLAGLWVSGFIVVLSFSYLRWRKVSTTIRHAVPLREGREVEALRRMERIGGVHGRIEILLSSASLEPGVFGIVHPVLLWPEGISKHLQDAHLEAIVAHEVWHVRSRDNLAAALHMLIEAAFWFYPLVWWLGVQLVEERERACDEAVLQLGSERHVYAESILKTCEFCVGFPLICIPGVTGADLKERIVHIMTPGEEYKLNFSKKLLLALTALAAVAAPMMFGLLHTAPGLAETRAENSVSTSRLAAPLQASLVEPDRTATFTIPKTGPRRTKVCAKTLAAHKAAAKSGTGKTN